MNFQTGGDTSNTVEFKSLVTGNGPPLVFKQAAEDWPPGEWTLDHLNILLGDKLMNCKISVVQPEEFQWESDCVHVQITMQQYIDWLYDSMDVDNPLKLFDRQKFSCYIDYKYMKDMFQDHPDQLKSVSWKMFGLDDRDGEDSTIWIGSQGAYTPCHQDSYGFNLVAQIQGRKRWYLFDPSQTDCMYPTRIPYEESSVYSEVNIRYPDLTKHPLFKKTTPFIVELVPGDVLYVPRHWWHFVESLEPTLTINTWVPLAEDRQSRVEESISRLLFSSLASSVLSHTQCTQYLNTGEELHDASVNVEYVRTATQDFIDSKDFNTERSDEACQKEILAKQKSSLTDHCVDYFDSFVNKFKDEQVILSTPCSMGDTAPSVILATRMNLEDSDNLNCNSSAILPGTDGKSQFKKRKLDSCILSRTTKQDNVVVEVEDNTVVSCKSEEFGKARSQIYAIPATQFEDFICFLEDKFEYETFRGEKESQGSDSFDSNTAKSKHCSSYPTLHDIINTILEPSVISHISTVLLSRCQK